MKINLNDQVRFQPTPKGYAAWRAYLARGAWVKQEHVAVSPGPLTLSLWEFSHAFGPALVIGMGELLIVNNELEILERGKRE